MQARRTAQLAAFLERSAILSGAAVAAALRTDGLAPVQEALTHRSASQS
jgi:hypothetical protein